MSPDRGFQEIHVGLAGRQTPEDRFGAGVTTAIRDMVYQLPGSFDEDDDNPDGIDLTWPHEVLFPAESDEAAATPLGHGPAETSPSRGHRFPRVARIRMNLTALSQRFNLYFAAYQDEIYVYVPRHGPQILTSRPVMVLNPRKSSWAIDKHIRGHIDYMFGHQVNHLLVGELGDLEVLLMAYDDGDVAAYYTHHIADCLAARQPGSPRAPSPPAKFFYENVGISAWGLALHKQSRLIAVSSNNADVVVFAFALTTTATVAATATATATATPPPPSAGPTTVATPAPQRDSPTLWCGQTALALEKHIQTRTRFWKMIFPLPLSASNVPSVAFLDDDDGNADKVVASDIRNGLYFVNLWRLGSPPMRIPFAPSHHRHDMTGWCVMVLPPQSFRPARTVRETLGLLPDQLHVPPADSCATFADTTPSLVGLRDNALPLSRADAPPASHLAASGVAANQLATDPVLSDFSSDEDDNDNEETDAGASASASVAASKNQQLQPGPKRRWDSLFAPGWANGPETRIRHETERVLGRRLAYTVVPQAGQTFREFTARERERFENGASDRQAKAKGDTMRLDEFSRRTMRGVRLLHTTSSDIKLVALDPKLAGVHCRGVLRQHNHHRLRPVPWDMAAHIAERNCMALHVPQLGAAVVGSLCGRVAVLTLTRAPKGAAVRRGFRVDWVLPRQSDEDRKLRPFVALLGMAVSPLPQSRARGLELRAGAGGGAALPQTRWRLVLHYMDHTILTYDMRRNSPQEDMLIF